MDNFIKYFKQNKKEIFNILMLSIIPIYIIFTIIFPSISIKASKNIIVQIIIVVSVLYFIININKFKLNKKKIKNLAKSYEEFMNKHILVKALTILVIINILTNIFNYILN